MHKQLHAFYVRPYVRRNKTDAADADALVRANQDPHLLPVPTKQPDQQSLQGLHRIRQQLIQTRTQRINLARALMAEFGISLTRGTGGIAHRLNAQIEQLPPTLQASLREIIADTCDLKERINLLDKRLKAIADHHPVAQQLMSVPGIGVITSTALVASVPDIHLFKRGRQFAAWLGITPREHSSGNNRKLGRISKQGNEYLRTLIIHGARSVMLQAHRCANKGSDLSALHQWLLRLELSKPRNVVAVAVANKLARAVWVTWALDKQYSP